MTIDQDSPAVQARRHLHEAINEAARIDPVVVDDEEIPGHIKSWVCIATLTLPDDSASFFVTSSDAIGEGDLTPWEEQGLLVWALDRYRRNDAQDDD